MKSVTADGSLRSPTGGVEGVISYTSYSRTKGLRQITYNGYDNINLEPNAMNNIDTVAHMNMHYTQY